jgi:hypothetical protein
MKIEHPAVRSDVFKLVATLEFDLEFGDHFLPTRIELFQDTERRRHWRCRLWERELFRIQSTFPQKPRGRPTDPPSDEELLVERTWELSDCLEDFEARDGKAAVRRVLDCLRKHLRGVEPATQARSRSR